MIPRLLIATIAVGLALTPAPTGPIAGAVPDGSVEQCSFWLTAPVVSGHGDGFTRLTATLVASGCQGTAAPVSSTVCIAASAGGTRCASATGWSLAEVDMQTAAASGTYTANGTGCWHEPADAGNPCVALNPLTVTT